MRALNHTKKNTAAAKQLPGFYSPQPCLIPNHPDSFCCIAWRSYIISMIRLVLHVYICVCFMMRLTWPLTTHWPPHCEPKHYSTHNGWFCFESVLILILDDANAELLWFIIAYIRRVHCSVLREKRITNAGRRRRVMICISTKKL